MACTFATNAIYRRGALLFSGLPTLLLLCLSRLCAARTKTADSSRPLLGEIHKLKGAADHKQPAASQITGINTNRPLPHNPIDFSELPDIFNSNNPKLATQRQSKYYETKYSTSLWVPQRSRPAAGGNLNYPSHWAVACADWSGQYRIPAREPISAEAQTRRWGGSLTCCAKP